MLNRANDKVSRIPRLALLESKVVNNTDTNPIVFSTPYSREYKNICSIVKNFLPVLSSDPVLNDVLTKDSDVYLRKRPL